MASTTALVHATVQAVRYRKANGYGGIVAPEWSPRRKSRPSAVWCVHRSVVPLVYSPPRACPAGAGDLDAEAREATGLEPPGRY